MMIAAKAESIEYGLQPTRQVDISPVVIVSEGTHAEPDLPARLVVSSNRPMSEAVLAAMAAYPDARDVVYIDSPDTLRARSLRHIIGALRNADHSLGGGALVYGNTEPRPQSTWRDSIAVRLGRGMASSRVAGNVFGIHRDPDGNVERLVSELPNDISTDALPQAGIALFLDEASPGGSLVPQPDINLNVIYLRGRQPGVSAQDLAAACENDHFFHDDQLAA